MANVGNTEVFGLAGSIYRSGYPMMDHAPDEVEFKAEVRKIDDAIESGDLENRHLKRAIRLANSDGGGHDQFLTGILVNFDLTLSNKAWVEAERYRFLSFISSMSTMHRAAVLPMRSCCNQYVSAETAAKLETLQHLYNTIDGSAEPDAKKAAYLELLYNLPAGFELMAGMTTNYRCLRNIYRQRRCHRLPDWHVVCDWIERLPLSAELITGENAGHPKEG